MSTNHQLIILKKLLKIFMFFMSPAEVMLFNFIGSLSDAADHTLLQSINWY